MLQQKLYEYIGDNNPDVLISLQERSEVAEWLSGKIAGIETLLTTLSSPQQPAYIIEAACMQELTRELRPSRFLYTSAVLESEFENHFHRLQANGILTYELINLLTHCHPVFDAFGFSEENEDNRFLHYAITGTVREYLEQRERETVDYGIQHRQAIRS